MPAAAPTNATARADAAMTPPSLPPAPPADAGISVDAVPVVLYFPPPGTAWETALPASAGFDQAKLSAALDFAGEHASKAMVVLWNGRIVAERYWDADANYFRDIASAQKSIVAVLVGMAQTKGLLKLADRVTDRLGPGWTNEAADAEARILLEHLITMTSGLDDSLRAEAPPGTRWRYTNDAFHQVQPVLEKVTGMGIEPVTRGWLWNSIGVSLRSRWFQRVNMADIKGRPLWGLVMTARDMARFGLLIQAGGRWNGQTIIADAAYLAAALETSQTLNPSYGYLWWLNGKAAHLLPPSRRRDGWLIPAAPADLVAALGKDDQKIYISRSEGLVVTRLGEAAAAQADALSDFDDQLWAKLMAARLR